MLAPPIVEIFPNGHQPVCHSLSGLVGLFRCCFDRTHKEPSDRPAPMRRKHGIWTHASQHVRPTKHQDPFGESTGSVGLLSHSMRWMDKVDPELEARPPSVDG